MKVLLCSYFKYPQGDAGAIRHEKLAFMLQELNHEVLVVGLGAYCEFQVIEFGGIAYTSLRESKTDFWGKVKSRLGYWSRLKKIISVYAPEAILMDDMRPNVTLKLKSLCKKQGIKLIHDSVEWYSPEQFKLGIFSPSCIKKNITNRFLIDKQCRVVAISQYLYDYYSSKKIQCVNIPIVASEEDLVKDKSLKETISFTYAGQAGKKDYLNIILSAMALLTDEERRRFKFHILGCTAEQIVKNGVSQETINIVKNALIFYGRVPRSKVLEVLKETDFTILMRSEEQRYAKAGFPTKLVESLSHSTPMIANITSDMERYLSDGYNALIVSQCDPEALAIVLKKAIKLSLEQRIQMCENAYETVVDKLHYKYFTSDLEKIMK